MVERVALNLGDPRDRVLCDLARSAVLVLGGLPDRLVPFADVMIPQWEATVQAWIVGARRDIVAGVPFRGAP